MGERNQGRGPRWENGIAKPGDGGPDRIMSVLSCFTMLIGGLGLQ